MSNFLFHKVSEKEKEQIKKQAKSIMNDFSKKLSKFDKQKIPESFIERPKSERQEGDISKEEFSKEIMFKNAPNKNNTLKGTSDYIIAEKKKW